MKPIKNDIEAASKLLASGSISSAKLTSQCLAIIREKEPNIGAFLHIDEELALKAAKRSDLRRQSGQILGPLDGIPVGLKDMILTTDMPTTAASKILEGYMSPYDAFVTQRLREEGAVIIGKNNQDEFAFGSSNETSAYKLCFNPWDLKKTPGGSSGGSAAAVASNMVLGTLGTDTGGSIRQPAAYCGVVGIKPTYGRVSRYGVVAFASSLDQVGVFAKTVKGAAMMLNGISGFDPRDSTSSEQKIPDFCKNLNSVKNKRIGVPKEYFTKGLEPKVSKAVHAAIKILEAQGASIQEISLPHTPHAVATYYIIATAEASSNLARYDGVRYGPREAGSGSLSDLYEQTRGKLFGPEVKRRIILGSYVLSSGYYDAYYLTAQKVRRLFADDFASAFSKVDAIISPTTPTTAFRVQEKIDDPLAMYLNDIYTIGANLAGLPGLSLPVGFDDSGMPIGAQILAKHFDEQTCFDLAYAIERELNLCL